MSGSDDFTRFPYFLSGDAACSSTRFRAATDGTFLSRPDSSGYALQVMPGDAGVSKASCPLIQIDGEPLMFRLTASS
jgi:hypothetical protein